MHYENDKYRRADLLLYHLKATIMDYRTPFWKRLNERLSSAEKSLRMLEPIENLVELGRLHKDIKQLFFTMKELEEKIYTTKRVLNFEEVWAHK